MKTPKSERWNILFGLWSLQGIAALSWLILIPTDTENPFAFGFSPARFALIGIAAALTLISVLLWFQSHRAAIHQTWLDLDGHFAFWDCVYLGSLLATAAALAFRIAVPLFENIPLYPIYAARLQPLVLWFGLSGLELAGLIAWNRRANVADIFATLQPLWRKIVLLLLIFLCLGILIAVTKIGITPDDNWGGPPVPFFEWQVLLTLAFMGGFAFLSTAFPKGYQKWIPLGIYAFTVILWLSQPVNTAFTATPPRAPNFEIYPFSDPQFYAQYAQSALTGNGFLWPDIPARPFYVAFLTWLHLAAQNYQNIILLQTFVLAVFPVVLYLVGRQIGGIPLGLGLALLTAFRDVNSNMAAPFASNVTYSKLLLSELPAALLISLATLLAIRWLRSTSRSAGLAVLIGGLFGAAALIRLQSSVLIAPLILFALFIFSDRKRWLRDSLLMGGAFALTLLPWLTRNYMAAGGLVLDNPISQTMTMARRWSGSTGNEIIARLPGENDARYSSRLTGIAIASFKRNPGFILRSAANHFVNNEVTSLLAFPVRDEIQSASELWMPKHEFWKTPLAIRQLPLVAFYLLLFVIGLTTAWHSQGWVGLLPLALGLMYNLWTALFLSSGVRFIVPLDWSIHLYELLGLIALGALLFSFTQAARENISNWFQMLFKGDPVPERSPEASRRHFLLSLIAVLFLGAFLPVTESVFPQKYPPRSQNEIMQQIGTAMEDGEVALYGRAIYPRYYEAGDGEPGTAKLGYGPEEAARLVFFLIGPESELVIFELESAPEFFPNASDVYMIGTQSENYFSPRIVKVIKDSQTELYRNK